MLIWLMISRLPLSDPPHSRGLGRDCVLDLPLVVRKVGVGLVEKDTICDFFFNFAVFMMSLIIERSKAEK